MHDLHVDVCGAAVFLQGTASYCVEEGRVVKDILSGGLCGSSRHIRCGGVSAGGGSGCIQEGATPWLVHLCPRELSSDSQATLILFAGQHLYTKGGLEKTRHLVRGYRHLGMALRLFSSPCASLNPRPTLKAIPSSFRSGVDGAGGPL
jgi:hypothetical protein